MEGPGYGSDEDEFDGDELAEPAAPCGERSEGGDDSGGNDDDDGAQQPFGEVTDVFGGFGEWDERVADAGEQGEYRHRNESRQERQVRRPRPLSRRS